MKRTLFFFSLTLFITAMLGVPATAQDCVEPPTGLISWWPGDGNTDDVFAGHDGTILGGMGFEPGMVGDAFSADGVDDYIQVPNTGGVFDLVSQWSIHAWVFPRSLAIQGVIVSKMSFVGNRITFALTLEGGDRDCSPGPGAFTLRAHLERASDDRDFWFCAQDHLPELWYHVVAVYDGNDMIIYVDGVEESRNTIGSVISYASSDPLMIGIRRPNTDTQIFDGLLDEVALWNRGLSGEEVRAIFDAGSAGMCQPVPPPTIEELLERIEALEDHTHTYLTGSGVGHNNTEAETGEAGVPED
jgi:hypothetical protein